MQQGLRQQKSVGFVVWSQGTGNWLWTGEHKEEALQRLDMICRANPYSSYELREVDRVYSDTGLSIGILGRLLIIKRYTLEEGLTQLETCTEI
jgi:hypothetical protein